MSQKEAEKLKFLQEISAAVSTVFNFDALLRIVIEKILNMMNCSRCSIVLLDENNNPFIKIGKGFNNPGFLENERIEKTGNITNKVLNSRVSILNEEHNFLCVPIINNNKSLGVINVTDRNDDSKFSEEEKNLLEILSTQIGYAIETIKLHKNIIKMEKINREMELASNYQEKIVREIYNIDNIQVKSFYRTAFEVGGDYFECFKLDNNRHLVCIGDVSGKGLYASIIVVMLHTLIKTKIRTCEGNIDLVKFVDEVNTSLLEEIGSDSTFATMFFMCIDSEKNEIEYINAGHNYPIFIKDNNIEFLKTGGMFIGAFEGIKFESNIIKYSSGDLLTLYSDGVVEYKDNIEDYIGEKDRFVEIINKNKEKDLNEIMKKIMTDYYNFEKKNINDDVSILMLRF